MWCQTHRRPPRNGEARDIWSGLCLNIKKTWIKFQGRATLRKFNPADSAL
jgi:hypothetical protein